MNEINNLFSTDFIYNSLSLSSLNSAVQNSKKIISNIVTEAFTNSYNHLKEKLQFARSKLNISFTQPCLKTPQAITTAFSYIKKIFGMNQTFKQLTLPNGDLYLGELKNSQFCGQGKLTKANGNVYEGQFQNNLYNGQGKFTLTTGSIFEGLFKDGFLHGQGKYTLSNGSSFEGEFENGLMHGKGKFTYSNGDIYEGDFKNNLYHGNGKLICTDGFTYEGEYQNDIWNGKGKVTYSNGDIYEGQFKNGLLHGKVKFILSNGASFEGEYQNNKKNGKGKLTYSNGDIYEGEFKNNHRDGKGKITSINGLIYEGEFKDDKRHGEVKLISLLDGLELSGLWKNDIWLNNNNFDLAKIISQDFFLKFLLGKNKAGLERGIWEVILSNILKTIKNPKIQEKANLLENINQFLSKEPDIAAELILKQLQIPNNPCLISYGCKKHAMGMLFTAKKDHLKITIFNSGWGLQQYHQKLTPTEKIKFRTKIDVLIPKENLTKDTLISILNTPNNSDIDDAYQKIFQLEDKNLQTSSVNSAIWQAPQKGPNCSLEWIFTFLKNTLPLKDYIELRIKIFELALEGLKKNITLSPEDKDSYRIELQRKIEKRKSKLKKLYQNLNEKTSAQA